jgi:hypothetical protein
MRALQDRVALVTGTAAVTANVTRKAGTIVTMSSAAARRPHPHWPIPTKESAWITGVILDVAGGAVMV